MSLKLTKFILLIQFLGGTDVVEIRLVNIVCEGQVVVRAKLLFLRQLVKRR